MIIGCISLLDLQVALSLHYLLSNYKHQLGKEEKHYGKKILRLLNKLGHRVPSRHRRGVQNSVGGCEPHSLAPVEEFQVIIVCVRERYCSIKWIMLQLFDV